MPEQLAAFGSGRQAGTCAWSAFCMEAPTEGSCFCLPHTRAALGLDQPWLAPMHDAEDRIDEIDDQLAARLEAEYEEAGG